MTDERWNILETKHKLGYDALGAMEQHLINTEHFVDGCYSAADIALYAYTYVADEGGSDLTGCLAVWA